LYDGRNASHFHFAYEGYRWPQTAGAGELTVPTALMKRGDFSDWRKPDGSLIPIYDPVTTRAEPGGFWRQPFPANQIPPSRLSPIALNIAKWMPDPNVPGALVRNLRTYNTMPRRRVENAITTRVDQNFGTANRLAFSFTKNGVWWDNAYDKDRGNWNNWGPRLPHPLAGRLYHKGDQYWGQVYRLKDTHLLTPTVVNTLTLGYTMSQHTRRAKTGAIESAARGTTPARTTP
jgi:hypothetical protein